MRSAAVVRAALAGAVICLIAVGVTAPALAGSGDGAEACPDVGPVEALLHGRACTEKLPDQVLAPGSLLNPQFPEFPDFPGLDDEDGDSDDNDSGDNDADDESGDDSDSDEASDEAEESDSDSDSEDAAAAADEGSDDCLL